MTDPTSGGEERSEDAKDELEDSLKELTKVIELDAGNALAWHDKGIALINLHRFQDALEPLSKAIELDPGNALAWHNKAIAYTNLGRSQDAIDALNKVKALEHNARRKRRAAFFRSSFALWRRLDRQLAVALTILTATFYIFVRANYDNFYDRLGVTPEEVGLDFAALVLRLASWLFFLVVVLAAGILLMAIAVAIYALIFVLFPIANRVFVHGIGVFRRSLDETLKVVLRDVPFDESSSSSERSDHHNGFVDLLWKTYGIVASGLWVAFGWMLLGLAWIVLPILLLSQPLRASIYLIVCVVLVPPLTALSLHLVRRSFFPSVLQALLVRRLSSLHHYLNRKKSPKVRHLGDSVLVDGVLSAPPRFTVSSTENPSAHPRILWSALWVVGLVMVFVSVYVAFYIVLDATQVVPKVNRIVRGERVQPAFFEPLAVRADPVKISWTGDSPRPNSLSKRHRFTYLGQAQGVVVLFVVDGPAKGRTLRVPSGSILLSNVSP
ncbi:MAG: tetratricopeptide repeat protein [Actinomycetota bacterium]